MPNIILCQTLMIERIQSLSGKDGLNIKSSYPRTAQEPCLHCLDLMSFYDIEP